ncbi:MAG: ParB/RepB/Spo0J family partition protein [Negativicutes bacterium]|nr:ParB/RepB/Spo0J family partition protein [Negativicutes bacterium]
MKLVEIELKLIDEDIEQPRKQFDKVSIEELAESIREVGLLNPIKVYKVKYGRYKIVFGNRRFKALKLLGFRKIPCILSDNTDELDIYLEQLTENIQRRDFTPIEEALGFEKLLDGDGRWKVSKKYLASKLGKTEKHITNKLGLLVFGEEIRKIIHSGSEIAAGKLSEEQVLHLKDVPVEYRDQLAMKVAKDGRSAKDVKRIAQLFMSAEADPRLKEKFLRMPCHELIALSVDGERLKELEKAANPPKVEPPKAAESPEAAEVKAPKPEIEASLDLNPGVGAPEPAPRQKSQPQEIIQQQLGKIPAFQPLEPAIIATLSAMSGEERQRLTGSVGAAIATLESQVKQWTEIKAILEAEK